MNADEAKKLLNLSKEVNFDDHMEKLYEHIKDFAQRGKPGLIIYLNKGGWTDIVKYTESFWGKKQYLLFNSIFNKTIKQLEKDGFKTYLLKSYKDHYDAILVEWDESPGELDRYKVTWAEYAETKAK